MSFQPMLMPLPNSAPLQAAITLLSETSEAPERGAVFTRPEVVSFILDLVGYVAERPLYQERLLEPSFGEGEFLREAVRRLLASYRAAGLPMAEAVDALRPAIRAAELHRDSFERTRVLVREDLLASGMGADHATMLLDSWLVCDDFLLTPLEIGFTKIVGNPPYLRQEMIPSLLLNEYRRRFRTLYDRADLYIPFIERSLGLLAAGGELSFICADRWLKNRYGGPLRRMIATEGFHLRAFVDMVGTQAFDAEVMTYPGIFVIRREQGTMTAVARPPRIEPAALKSLAEALNANQPDDRVTTLEGVASDDSPWVFGARNTVSLLRRLEATLPTLEEAGCKVGIGVATGADRVFIGPYESLPVEPERKLPLAMAADLKTGEIRWSGQGVLNPFGDDGKVVPLEAFPQFASYIEERSVIIKQRNVAKKNPTHWYRTIDRIHRGLTWKPKLLIPDIKARLHVVFDEGKLYPHHNLYFVLSYDWDLRALQALLLSDIACFFVSSYSTKMRGGFLRFQAQYLRRIRIPYWRDVPQDLRSALSSAAIGGDRQACNDLTATLYKLSTTERAALHAVSFPTDSP